jgi:hypothetical protein
MKATTVPAAPPTGGSLLQHLSFETALDQFCAMSCVLHYILIGCFWCAWWVSGYDLSLMPWYLGLAVKCNAGVGVYGTPCFS